MRLHRAGGDTGAGEAIRGRAVYRTWRYPL